MAKRALLSRLGRLEIEGSKVQGDSKVDVRNPIASLELKVGGETQRLPSLKAVKEEKVKLERVKRIESREQALRLIEKFREIQKRERADSNDRHWRAEQSDEQARADAAIQTAEDSWRIARIAGRLTFGFFLLYVGLRGTLNLIDIVMNPPNAAQIVRPSAIWIGIGFIVLGWLLPVARRRLLAYEAHDWVPYARTVCLAWTPLVAMTALLFLARVMNPNLETFIRLGYVYGYVTLLACWFHFLLEV